MVADDPNGGLITSWMYIIRGWAMGWRKLVLHDREGMS